jgi:HPt (histidine-containing phosphotransfer) domain-containing protein
MSTAHPPGTPATDFEEAMKRFQREFAAQLPARLGEAEQLLAACREAPVDDARLLGLHRCVHKLAGTAGTFGMPEVSREARAIEDVLDSLLARAGRDRAAFDTAAGMLDALAQRARAA